MGFGQDFSNILKFDLDGPRTTLKSAFADGIQGNFEKKITKLSILEMYENTEKG